jgi:hypothetical protein
MVTVEAAMATAATLVAVAFGLCTLERWLDRRRPHELAWTVSLAMFAIASGALWFGTAHGWDPAAFRVFFLFGAVLNVPYLALGSIYLLWGRRAGDRWAAVITALACFAVGVLCVAPLKGPVPADDLPQGSQVFGALPRVLAGVASGVAATAVIVLAVLSAVRVLRGRSRGRAAGGVAHPGRLAAGNALIALGTLVLGASGTLNGRLGAETAFSVTLVTGVVILFAGFLVATAASASRPAAARPKPLAWVRDADWPAA